MPTFLKKKLAPPAEDSDGHVAEHGVGVGADGDAPASSSAADPSGSAPHALQEDDNTDVASDDLDEAFGGSAIASLMRQVAAYASSVESTLSSLKAMVRGAPALTHVKAQKRARKISLSTGKRKDKKEKKISAEHARSVKDSLDNRMLTYNKELARGALRLLDLLSNHLEGVPATSHVSLRLEVIGDWVTRLRSDIRDHIDLSGRWTANVLDELARQQLEKVLGAALLDAEELKSAATPSFMKATDEDSQARAIELVVDAKTAIDELEHSSVSSLLLDTSASKKLVGPKITAFRGAVDSLLDFLQAEGGTAVRSQLQRSSLSVLEVAAVLEVRGHRGGDTSLEEGFEEAYSLFETALKHVLLFVRSNLSWADFSMRALDRRQLAQRHELQRAATTALAALEDELPEFTKIWAELSSTDRKRVKGRLIEAIGIALPARRTREDGVSSSTARGLHAKLFSVDTFDLRGLARSPAPSSSPQEGALVENAGASARLGEEKKLARATMNARMLNALMKQSSMAQPPASPFATPSTSPSSAAGVDLPHALMFCAESVESLSHIVLGRYSVAVRHAVAVMEDQVYELYEKVEGRKVERLDTDPIRTGSSLRRANSSLRRTNSMHQDFSELLLQDKAQLLKSLDKALLLSEHFSFSGETGSGEKRRLGVASPSEQTPLSRAGGKGTLKRSMMTHTFGITSETTALMRQQHALLKILDDSRQQLQNFTGPGEVTSSVARSLSEPQHALSALQYNGTLLQFGGVVITKLHLHHAEFRSAIAQLSANMRFLSFESARRATSGITDKSTNQAFATIVQVTVLARRAALLLMQMQHSFETLMFLGRVRTVSEEMTGLAREASEDSLNPCCADENVWEEGEAHDNPLFFSADSDQAAGADFNQLIIYLAPLKSFRFSTDPTVKLFLRTYRTMHVSPHALFDKILERARGPPAEDTPRAERRKLGRALKSAVDKHHHDMKPLEPHVAVQVLMSSLQLLRFWVEDNFREDFDDLLIQRLRHFLLDCKERGEVEIVEFAVAIMESLERLEAERQVAREELLRVHELPAPSSPPLSMVKLLTQFTPEEVARQLTVIDSLLYRAINTPELLDQAWNVDKRSHMSPNVKALLQRANDQSYWVASRVLQQRSADDRAEALTFLIEIAAGLQNLNNMNGLMAMVAGLHISAVSRLKKSWAKVDPATRAKVEPMLKIFDPSSSYKAYRTYVQAIEGPVIPYIGVYLTDLTFADEGNDDYVNKKDSHGHQLFNMQKRAMTSKIIGDLLRFQKSPHKIPVAEPLNSFLLCLSGANDKELYELSLKVEAREKV